MKIFIWNEIEKCSDNYHTEGGLVVIAETEERAREMVSASKCSLQDSEKPDEVFDLTTESDPKEKVFVFPDAGCC